MAWEENLLDASFGDLVFECVATDDEVARAVAVHSYPYINGAVPEDMGGEPFQTSIPAIFYGDDYDVRLKAFLAKLNETGQDDLVHPVFGTMKAQFMSAQVHHDADSPDQATVALRFMEAGDAPKFFSKNLPIQKATAVLQSNTATREAATAVLVDQVDLVVAGGEFNRIEQLRTSMTSVLSQFKSKVAGVIASGLDPIQFATSWASDLTSMVTGVVDLRSFGVDTLVADWRAVFSSFDDAILLPTQARQPAADINTIAAHVALEQATGRADAASQVLASETQIPTLSPVEIETMVNASRTEIQTVIDLYRTSYGLEKSRPVAESLKTTALTLQEAARAVIEARPPLVEREMAAPGNLRLIAHELYGDHTRAPELFRLNPKAKMPNYLDRGDVLNAYAN